MGDKSVIFRHFVFLVLPHWGNVINWQRSKLMSAIDKIDLMNVWYII